MAAAAAANEDPSSVSEFIAESADDPEAQGVRCVVHNFPDDSDDGDAESTIRSLLEPDVIVRHCQQSTTGLLGFISGWLLCFIRPKAMHA